jgi:hypothetical protein
MEELCEFIRTYAPTAKENLGLSVIQEIKDKENYLNNIIKYIENNLYYHLDHLTEIEYFYDNLCVQAAPIISFKYKNVCCNICEHFDDKRDYWRASITPI